MLDPDGGEPVRFTFPRQDRHQRLCLADYLRPAGERDVVALQLVTAGAEATEHIDALQAAEEYSEAYFAHGLAIEAAEGLAEYVHRRIRPSSASSRPRPPLLVGLPGLSRPRPARAGAAAPARRRSTWAIELSAAYQFIPEQTTAAIVIHHPQAVYFQRPPRRPLRL